jgi:DNA-binding PadR family transcriptional regulator
MSLKHAILGFLSFKSLSGYDLKKAFDHSIHHFWPANQSQIYRTLAGLKDDGLVGQEVIEREERLDMKIYHITEAGQEELHRWLSTPLQASDSREPFLIQVYFGGKLSDDEIIDLLQHEIRAAEERLVIYDTMYKQFQELIKTSEDPRATFLSVTTLEYGILSNLNVVEWMKSIVERVKNKDYTLRDFHQSS